MEEEEQGALVEELCRMGFSKRDAQKAMRKSHGDFVVAMDYLLGQNKKGQPKPRGPQHVNMFGAEPQTEQELAAWTSPLYVKVGGYLSSLTDENGKRYTGYIVTVIAKDGHRWQVTKRFQDFKEMNRKIARYLPGITAQFPSRAMFGMSDSDRDERRDMLDKWMREICRVPSYICNEVVIRELSMLLDVEAQLAVPLGRQTEESESPLLRTRSPLDGRTHASPIDQTTSPKYPVEAKAHTSPSKTQPHKYPASPVPVATPIATSTAPPRPGVNRSQSQLHVKAQRPAVPRAASVFGCNPFDDEGSNCNLNPFDDDDEEEEGDSTARSQAKHAKPITKVSAKPTAKPNPPAQSHANPFDDGDDEDDDEPARPSTSNVKSASPQRVEPAHPVAVNPFDDEDDDDDVPTNSLTPPESNSIPTLETHSAEIEQLSLSSVRPSEASLDVAEDVPVTQPSERPSISPPKPAKPPRRGN